jgi:breast cancer 2 susceptibility protein
MVLCVAAIRVLNDPSRPNSDQWFVKFMCCIFIESLIMQLLLFVARFEDYQSVLASAGPNAIVEVTDGWYSINAILDDYLTKHLHAGKIVCGTKLHVFGAEIVGSEQAKSPLDVTATTMMRLRLNGTKRSQWYTQLGFQKQGAFIIPLRALRANGGDVAKVDVFIQRVYPLTFSEKYMDTKTVRNTRGEEVASDRFNERRRTFIEQLAAKLTDEREKEKAVVRMQKQKQGGYSNYLAKVISGDIETEELYDIACSGSDLSEFMKLLTPTLQQRLADYAQRVAQEESDEINSTIRKTLEETPEWNREVTPILKMLVCDYTSSELTPASQYVASPLLF